MQRQIWQRVTGSWVTVTGKRREGDLLIYLYDASPAKVIVPELARPHFPRHESARKCAIATEIRDVLKVSENCRAD